MRAATADTPVAFDWNEIFAEVNAWRGACMHHFSAVEMAVTETLLALSRSGQRGDTVRLRQLIGQRFEDLARAIGAEGAFSEEGRAAAAELARYRDHQEAFRAQLCHGTIKVTVDPAGHWTMIVRTVLIRSRQEERGVEVIDRGEAQSRLAMLKQEGQQLASVLGQLRKAVASQKAP